MLTRFRISERVRLVLFLALESFHPAPTVLSSCCPDAMAPSTDPIYESPPPPRFSVDPAALPPQLKPTDVQQKMYDEVLQHFEKADYTIPDEENGALTEEEKFWLVRFGGTA